MNGAFNNLLSRALRNIPCTPIQWYKFHGSVINSMGRETTAYEQPIEVSNASAQPVNNREYEALNLNLQKRYIKVFVSADATVFANAQNPDKIAYNGLIWTVLSNQRWYPYDNWNQLLCVEDKSDITLVDGNGNLILNGEGDSGSKTVFISKARFSIGDV